MIKIIEHVTNYSNPLGNLLNTVWKDFNNLVKCRFTEFDEIIKEKNQQMSRQSIIFIDKFQEKFAEHEKIFEKLKNHEKELEELKNEALLKAQSYRKDFLALSEAFDEMKKKYDELYKENEGLVENLTSMHTLVCKVSKEATESNDIMVRNELIKQKLFLKTGIFLLALR